MSDLYKNPFEDLAEEDNELDYEDEGTVTTDHANSSFGSDLLRQEEVPWRAGSSIESSESESDEEDDEEEVDSEATTVAGTSESDSDASESEAEGWHPPMRQPRAYVNAPPGPNFGRRVLVPLRFLVPFVPLPFLHPILMPNDSPPVSPPHFDCSAFLMPDSDDELSTVDLSEFLSSSLDSD